MHSPTTTKPNTSNNHLQQIQKQIGKKQAKTHQLPPFLTYGSSHANMATGQQIHPRNNDSTQW